MSEFPIQTCQHDEATHAVFHFDSTYATAAITFHPSEFDAHRQRKLLTSNDETANVKVLDMEAWSGFVFVNNYK